ncbi:vWA domain-containing protein [Allorhodopirellula heiligendammensis]|uniref:von Willebrand factor type A domain protein n=1 Tax=Allorhodopirellula heiligendammensis TaxID=2714739 RepID=A0A5C6BY81_9BACT|nr:vWA domain-containing protein [Allorhodopirellula heiligendammensis]TWU16772.1 von Willebrand factor type A domain protein [Allorhodopirellula heiligendammensis]
MNRFLLPPALLCLAAASNLCLSATAQDVTITIKSTPPESDSSASDKAPFTGNRPAVDVAILLDTSNSMDGLINQAKNQLWNIVQQFAKAKKAGKTPQLRVSIFEYGNSRLPAAEDYIRQVVPLTDDLDKVSEALFALTTSGGDEYCGAVINEAIKRLDWSGEPNAYRVIFIAGNEPFDQGPLDFHTACKKAIGEGVVVNTIHCGNYDQGVRGHWQAGASLAEGKFLNINQDEKVVHTHAPQDKIIIELNAALNKTYLWYGGAQQRRAYASNQAQQDANAGSGLSSRAAVKSSSVYSNVGRDLVDTYDDDPAAITKLKADELPEELQNLAPEQLLERIQAMSKKRAEIKQKLAEASRERQAYVAAEQAKQPAAPGDATLGDAFSEAVEVQLEASGFEVEK